jgi:CubicO group peptidase (beta-lactamase class C family)
VQRALDQIHTWPVDHAAAAVRGPDGAVVTAGDTGRAFPLASVTKLLSAVAVLVAYEEGTLALDDPDLPRTVSVPEGATVRDLLCHASGLAPDRDGALAAPRRKRIYSNRGYELLAELVAERSAMPFEVYLREAVFEPLGMRETRLEGSAASGAVSTVEDLLRFAEALAPGAATAVLAPATRRELAGVQYPELDGVVPGFGSQSPNPWGLGPEIRGEKQPHWTGRHNSPATYGHFGRSGTFLWIDPVAAVTTVALTDRDFDEWAIAAWPALSDAVLTAAGPRTA